MFLALVFFGAKPVVAEANSENSSGLKLLIETPQSEIAPNTKGIPIKFILQNISQLDISFEILGCSYPGHFKTEGESFKISNKYDCIRNVPVLKYLKPQEKFEGNLLLLTPLSSGEYKFKVGFTPFGGFILVHSKKKDDKPELSLEKEMLVAQFWSDWIKITIK